MKSFSLYLILSLAISMSTTQIYSMFDILFAKLPPITKELLKQYLKESNNGASTDIHIENISTEIEFNGQKKPIIGWITACIGWGEKGKKEPFGVTRNIEYKKDKFIEKGDIFSLSPEDIEKIVNGNAVYCPYYAEQKTRLSYVDPGEPFIGGPVHIYESVGAIITGTQDCEKCTELHFANIHRFMKQMNQHKKNSEE